MTSSPSVRCCPRRPGSSLGSRPGTRVHAGSRRGAGRPSCLPPYLLGCSEERMGRHHTPGHLGWRGRTREAVRVPAQEGCDAEDGVGEAGEGGWAGGSPWPPCPPHLLPRREKGGPPPGSGAPRDAALRPGVPRGTHARLGPGVRSPAPPPRSAPGAAHLQVPGAGLPLGRRRPGSKRMDLAPESFERAQSPHGIFKKTHFLK